MCWRGHLFPIVSELGPGTCYYFALYSAGQHNRLGQISINDTDPKTVFLDSIYFGGFEAFMSQNDLL